MGKYVFACICVYARTHRLAALLETVTWPRLSQHSAWCLMLDGEMLVADTCLRLVTDLSLSVLGKQLSRM